MPSTSRSHKCIFLNKIHARIFLFPKSHIHRVSSSSTVWPTEQYWSSSSSCDFFHRPVTPFRSSYIPRHPVLTTRQAYLWHTLLPVAHTATCGTHYYLWHTLLPVAHTTACGTHCYLWHTLLPVAHTATCGTHYYFCGEFRKLCLENRHTIKLDRSTLSLLMMCWAIWCIGRSSFNKC